VAKKQKRPVKHIPQRTCVGCREILSKRELMRVVRTDDGVVYDPSGKANGRGAYIHDQRECWKKALSGSLEKALHTTIDEENRRSLNEIMDSLAASHDD
jgi:uncharacterized protein